MPRFSSETPQGTRLQKLVAYGISAPDEHGPVSSPGKKANVSPHQLQLEFPPVATPKPTIDSPLPATHNDHPSQDKEDSSQELSFEQLFTSEDTRKVGQKLASFTTLFSQGRIRIAQHNWEYGFVGHDDTDAAQLSFVLLEDPSHKTGPTKTVTGKLAEEIIEFLNQQPEREHMDGAPEIAPTPRREAVLAAMVETLAVEKNAPQQTPQAPEFVLPPRNPEHDALVAEFNQQLTAGRVTAVSQSDGEFTYLLAPRNWQNYKEKATNVLQGGRPVVRFEYKTDTGGTYFPEAKRVTGDLAYRFEVAYRRIQEEQRHSR